MDRKEEYKRLRAKGWPAKSAWETAAINTAFWLRSEIEGRLRFEVIPDVLDYDDSYLECQGLTPSQIKRARKELWRRIENEGVHMITSLVRCPCCDEQTPADSVSGFIGRDYEDSGYDSDLKQSALNKLEELQAKMVG